LAEDMQLLFREFANEKGIDFQVKNYLPADLVMETDRVRIEQILKNLLSNAFKFTPAGGEVELKIKYAKSDMAFKEKSLLKADQILSIAVRDSGIGISEEKQHLVFEAFQQADGSTSRKYGGTGLGLAICKELAHNMGGEITLESTEGVGSIFSVHLPTTASNTVASAFDDLNNTPSNSDEIKDKLKELDYYENEIRDDRNNILSGDKVILIIEDDYVFARMLMNHCHRYGFKAIVALQGDQGLSYAYKYMPYAILLDLRLPVMDGWTILKKLKEDKELYKIPVHVISSVDKKQLGLELGAVSYGSKPTGKEDMESLFNQIMSNDTSKRMLVIGEHNDDMKKIVALIEAQEQQIKIKYAENIEDCINQLRNNHFECMMINNFNSDTKNIIQQIKDTEDLKNIPMIFSSSNPDECLREVRDIIRIVDDHKLNNAMVENSEFSDNVNSGFSSFENLNSKMEELLRGKVVLVVDDDVRNIYSMTNILESEGLQIITAFDGLDGLEKLKENPQIEIVLMDIMMPNMNGYEAIAEIRKNPDFKKLPIIAVTAKAMNGDREKSMEAGASDYMTKPIQADQLISLMRIWLYK
jgi:CheY-like chemotaxis protein